MQLLKSQRNEVFDLIAGNGLSPLNFEFEVYEDEGEYNTRLLYKMNYDFWFVFGFSGAYFSPGKETSTQKYLTGVWSGITTHFVEWLHNLIREIEEPDKWEQLLKEGEFFKTKEGKESNTRFDYQEVTQIEASINQVKIGILQIGLREEDKELINQKLDYLLDRSKVLGRIDWKNIAISTFISVATNNLSQQYPKEVLHGFIALVKISFKMILLLV